MFYRLLQIQGSATILFKGNQQLYIQGEIHDTTNVICVETDAATCTEHQYTTHAKMQGKCKERSCPLMMLAGHASFLQIRETLRPGRKSHYEAARSRLNDKDINMFNAGFMSQLEVLWYFSYDSCSL